MGVQTRKTKSKPSTKRNVNRNVTSGSILKARLINARSIINKKQELESTIYEEKPHIVFITESWADEKHSTAELNIDGYDCIRKDRTRRGGGCLMYIQEELKAVPLNSLTDTENTDSVWCKIQDVTFGVCYNTTANTVEDEKPLLELLRKACGGGGEVIITGDFNHETIDWELMESQAEGQEFLDTVEDLFLEQHVTTPTREKNLLDLVLSTNPEQIRDVEVTEKFGSSDHNMVKFNVIMKEESKQWKEKFRDYRNADFDKIREEVKSINWSVIDDQDDMQDAWKKFTELLDKTVEKHVKVKERVRGKPPKPMWWNKKIYKLRRKRLKWWQKSKENKAHKPKYEFYQKRVVEEVKAAKSKLEERLARNIKEDRKGFFKYAKSKMKAKEGVGPIEDSDGNILRDEKKMAEEFSIFFKSIFTEEDTTVIPDPEPVFTGTEEEKLTTIDITEERVLKKLKQINPSKSAGNDNISNAVLKETAEEITEAVTKIFKRSLEESKLPEDWKTSNITPIYKKDGRNKVGNYRGVHLTSQLCKTMESLVKEDIVDHLSKFNLIRGTQHGFTEGKSCFTNLLMFLEDITKHIDEGTPVDVIYMDFRKAFDSVPHQRLLKKVKAHGISGKVYKWIEEWLTNREQRVVLKGETSSWEKVMSGVPQGSVLGPLLFIIYINDIDSNIVSVLSKFADDCKLAYKVATVEDTNTVQADIDTLGAWSEKWQLVFHPDKCKTLHFGHSNEKKQYYLNNQQIKSVTSEKDLGVYITEDLKQHKHVAEIAKRANRMLGMIKRTITCKSIENIMSYYKSLVRPIIDYASGIWNPYHKKDIIKLEKIQRRATKIITELRNKPYDARLKKCKLMTLEQRRRRYDQIEMFKVMKGIYKIDKDQLFELNKNPTRGHELKVQKKFSRLNVRKNFFTNRVVDDWNHLPVAAITAKNVLGFKKVMDPIFTGGLHMVN